MHASFQNRASTLTLLEDGRSNPSFPQKSSIDSAKALYGSFIYLHLDYCGFAHAVLLTLSDSLFAI